MQTKNISFNNILLYDKYDNIYEYSDLKLIKISDFIKILEEETLSNDKIEEITFQNCLLNAKLLKIIYDEFLNKKQSIKDNVIRINLSLNSYICDDNDDENIYSILLKLLQFPKLKFLNLSGTNFIDNIQNLNEYLKPDMKYLLKKIIFLDEYYFCKYIRENKFSDYQKCIEEELLSTDWKESHEEYYNRNEIDIKIDIIREKGLQLHLEKTNAFQVCPLFSTLDNKFDMNMLSLMKNIIDEYHYCNLKKNYSILEKDNFAKEFLKNILISAGLLTKEFKAKFNNTEKNREEDNFWNKFLLLFHYFINVLYSFSTSEIKELMESKSFQQIICERQIETNIHSLDIYPLITYKCEQYILDYAISYIKNMININIYNIKSSYHKSALLRYFIILGECCKNISIYTKELLTEIDIWNLFIDIANIISNNDINIESIQYIFTSDFFSELVNFKNILLKIREKIGTFDNKEIRDNHYTGKNVNENIHSISLPLLKDFYNKLNDSKMTFMNLEKKLTIELNALHEIFKIDGEETLKDLFTNDDSNDNSKDDDPKDDDSNDNDSKDNDSNDNPKDDKNNNISKNTNIQKHIIEKRNILEDKLFEEEERMESALYHHNIIYSLLIENKFIPISKDKNIKEYYSFGETVKWSIRMFYVSRITPSILIHHTYILLYEIFKKEIVYIYKNMSLFNIMNQDILDQILNDENFESLSKLYKDKKNKENMNEIIKTVDEKFNGKYIIQNVVIGTDIYKNITDYHEDYSSCTNFSDENEKIKFYKYIIKKKNFEKKDGYFDRLELIIFDHYQENLIGILMISYFNPDQKYRPDSSIFTKVFNRLEESHFLWDNFFNLSSYELKRYIDYIYDEVTPDFCTSELVLLEPIKILHNYFQKIDEFNYKI